jgi:uncharacterized C2H2 Zn-finger protein
MFKLDLFKRKKKDEKELIKCKYCDMKLGDKERMKRHVRKAHSEKGGDMPKFNPFGGS